MDNEPAEWVELYENVKNGLEPLIDVSPSLYQPGDDRKEPCLSVNSDGQASLGFFVWAARKAALPRLQGVSHSAVQSATAELVTRTFSVLLQAEVRSTMVDDLDIDPITDTLVSSDVNLPLHRLAVLTACSTGSSSISTDCPHHKRHMQSAGCADGAARR